MGVDNSARVIELLDALVTSFGSISLGTRWFQIPGPPEPSLGREGDFSLDTLTGDVYFKENGVWI